MNNRLTKSEDFDAYQRIDNILKENDNKDENHLSIIPKPKWLIVTIIARVAFLCYYGLTTILFGKDFWLFSVNVSKVR